MASAEGQPSWQMADLVESRLGQVGVGSRLRIFWQVGEANWPFIATIIAKDGSSPNTYTYLYDDGYLCDERGFQESFNLSQERFEVLDDAMPEAARAAIAAATYTNTTMLCKDLPVENLKQKNVQKLCINMHIQSLPGKWVRITDLVDSICDDLSPAGSYLICTGQHHVDEETGIRNYGETVRQNLEATREERRADYETKVKRLTHFFAKSPHVYEMQGFGADEETGRIRFEVCKAVVDLTANSDDEFGS